jgi:hypothetical protein
MVIGATEYEVSNRKPTKFNYKPYQGNADNPNDDKHLINVLSDSLDEVMSYIVTEVTRETDTRTAQP